MKILHITTHLNKGGIVSYLSSLAVELQKRGHRIVIASSGGHNEAMLRQQGIEHLFVPLCTKSELSPRLVSSYYVLQRYLSKNTIDIMHAHTRVAQVVASFLSKKSSIPLVTTCHGFFRARWHRRIFPCWGDMTIAISQPVKQHLITDFGVDETNIALIHNGVDITSLKVATAEERIKLKQHIGIQEGRFVVGYAGRFSTVKGLEYLIKAIPYVMREGCNVQFLLIGYGSDEPRLRRIASALSLAAGTLIFYRPQRDIHDYLDILDCFVMPSLQEGLGLAILEAQAKQVPVIASNVGGIPDIIDSRMNGLLVPPKDPEALAAAIVRLVREASLREYLQQNAFRRLTQHFTLSQMVDKTEALYTAVFAGSGSR